MERGEEVALERRRCRPDPGLRAAPVSKPLQLGVLQDVHEPPARGGAKSQRVGVGVGECHGVQVRHLTGEAANSAPMLRFTADDGIEIAYTTFGDEHGGVPVVLQHGFVADHHSNWVGAGMVAALVAAGRHIVALDARGHGRSDKPHDPSFYGERRMAADLSQLADHLGFGPFDLVGYSMGAIISAIVASSDPRVRRLCLGGIGGGVVDLGGVDTRVIHSGRLAEALETEDPAEITDPAAAGFRLFADAVGADRLALAAQARSVNTSPIALGRIVAPTLVVAGTEDPLAAHPERLAAAIANAEVFRLDGDHMAVPRAAEYHRRVAEFLAT